MTVTERKISELIAAEYNPRQLTTEQYEHLKSSLLRFGCVDPIIVNQHKDRKNIVVGGHQRLKVWKDLDRKTIPCVYVDLPLEKERELNVRLNRNVGGWDWDELANQFDIPELLEWGFTDEELGGAFGTDEPEPEQDAVPEPPSKAITAPGRMYQLGKHRLMCGDATSEKDVARLMDGEKAALVHADPPYGMGKEKDGVQNDNLYSDKLDSFQLAWWRAVRPNIEDNGSAYIWGNAEDLWRLWYVGGLNDSERLTFRNEIVWNKGSGQGMESELHRMFPTATERCLVFMLGEQGFNNNADNYWEGWDSVVNYLRAEKEKTGWDIATFKRLAGHSETSGCHWFDKSQWMFPTKEVYDSWQAAARDHDAFKRDHDELKRDHDELKRDHDELKREFYETRAYFDNTHDNMTDVWEFPRVTGEERQGHATPKPVAMMARAIESSCPRGAITVEPFGGSGTTLIACEQTNRACRMMEIDPRYCDVIVRRYANLVEADADKIFKTGVHDA